MRKLLKPISLDLEGFKKLTDYADNWFPFGFTLIRKSVITKGSVEEFIEMLKKKFAI